MWASRPVSRSTRCTRPERDDLVPGDPATAAVRVSALDDAPRFEPSSRADWRAWLEEHHASVPSVWVVSHTRRSGMEKLSYDDIVEEALCFGWVDGTVRKLDDDCGMLYLARRKPGGTWARSNKERVERLTAAGLMRPAGLAAIERAKADGSWTVLDAVEALEVPPDLTKAFRSHPDLRKRYEAATDGTKKQVLWRLVRAKRAETRARRLAELVQRAAAGEPLV